MCNNNFFINILYSLLQDHMINIYSIIGMYSLLQDHMINIYSIIDTLNTTITNQHILYKDQVYQGVAISTHNIKAQVHHRTLEYLPTV
jgi:hypothetical protein